MCIRTDILSTLSYFDLFNYPLTQAEIRLFMKNKYSLADFEKGMDQLVASQNVFYFDELFTLQNNYNIISRRRKGNLKARTMIETATRIATIISCFPYVRGVAVSGSLSKNYADESSDIDLFIITSNNRLWVARTLLHILKKLSYLLKKQQLFCMNYFVDESALEIEEKNIYTATEIATLLPLKGIEAFHKFYKANSWTKGFLPNHSMRVSYVLDIKAGPIKKLGEILFNNKLGDVFDKCLMKLTSSRWDSKTLRGKKNSHGVLMGMSASRHCAKPNPVNFQQKFLTSFEKRSNHVINSALVSKGVTDISII